MIGTIILPRIYSGESKGGGGEGRPRGSYFF